MATNPNLASRRAVRLGRSALTGQFVLKPVGRPSNIRRATVDDGAEFNVSERLILKLAAQRVPAGQIADKLGIALSSVSNTLETAKRRFATKTRLEAARRFVHSNKQVGSVD